MGDYASKAGKLAIEEINAAGGVLGRQLETIVDDETNPGVGVQKATKMIQQDKVDFLLGTVSSAVALAIMDVAERYQKIFFNTGSNSDEIRGAKCNYYTFCTEASNTQYVKAIGRYLVKNKNYKTFYILTSDYAFGHDLTRVTRRLLNELGGKEIGHDLVPTGTADYSSYLLKIRNAKPEVIFCNVAGADQTTFLKQYTEFGLKIDVAGGVTDTVLMWNAGKDTAQGVWTVIWWGDLDNAWTKNFVPQVSAEVRLAAGEPGLGRLHQHQGAGRGHQDGRHHRQQEGGRGPGEDQVRRRQGPRAVLPHLRPPAHAADVRGRHQEDRQQGQVRHLQRRRRGPGQGREPGGDRADQGREPLQHEARLIPLTAPAPLDVERGRSVSGT